VTFEEFAQQAYLVALQGLRSSPRPLTESDVRELASSSAMYAGLWFNRFFDHEGKAKS
jgi:hypothetical protein